MLTRVSTTSLLITFLMATLWGCANPRTAIIGTETDHAIAPTWTDATAYEPVPDQWLNAVGSPYITASVEEALANNFQLQQQALLLEEFKTAVQLSRADRLPSLSLSLGSSRNRVSDLTGITEQADVSANANMELDLWGRLSDAQRAARLAFQAQQLRYTESERQLVAQVIRNTYDLITAEVLQALFEQRLDNLTQGLDVIEKGYRSGLNEALDVYLAQTNVEQERANVANQKQVRFQAATDLERLTARYPDASTILAQPLPELSAMPGIGIPSETLRRRPDVQAAWLELLRTDAELAVAHKNRFPSLSISGSVRDTDSSIGELLDGGSLAFTAAASLLQPLFAGGRLRALNHQARLRVQQAEKNYLNTVYDAIAQVANTLNQTISLHESYNAFVKAQSNAEAASTLAFDQYLKGLVSYTTVLEAQRRAFDAQTSVVQLRNQRLQNRINLLLALGGNY